jgi:hypothetical protein
MAFSPETEIIVWLFTVPALVLLWAIARTYYRIWRGQESARLRTLEPSEVAAGAAALAAMFGFYS